MQRHWFQLVIVCLFLAVNAQAPATPAQAHPGVPNPHPRVLTEGAAVPTRPFRGSVKWSILLCRFSDSPAPPNPASYYRDMLVAHGTGGLNDYWRSVSYNGVNLDGSEVKGWYTEPYTIAQARARAGENRVRQMQDCIDAARTSPVDPYTVPAGNLIAVVTHPSMDLFGVPGYGAFFGSDADLGAFGHEVGHGLGLNHSFSDDPTYRNADWAAIGEYDDQWDVMSYANVYGTTTARFGSGGPGLNAFHVDRMGWMPRDRIYTFGAGGERANVVTLAALNHPETRGLLQVRIPFDPGDPYHYYTLEYRRNDGWDAGIPSNTLLIHEIKRRDDGKYYSYLVREHSGARLPRQTLNLNGVRIEVGINTALLPYRIFLPSITRGTTGTSPPIPNPNQLTVTIKGDIADRCLQGFVWREANLADHVCVTPEVREQTLFDNAHAAERRNPDGPYGPDTCIQGYVWREAFPGDHVCVLPETRAQAQADNAQAANRNNPARFVYGPNTCKVGFVWREADMSDWVCVTPEVRAQTRFDNAHAAERRNPSGPYGPDTCIQGYVWREAFPGDHVCVLPQTRAQAQADNAQASSRLAQP